MDEDFCEEILAFFHPSLNTQVQFNMITWCTVQYKYLERFFFSPCLSITVNWPLAAVLALQRHASLPPKAEQAILAVNSFKQPL